MGRYIDGLVDKRRVRIAGYAVKPYYDAFAYHKFYTVTNSDIKDLLRGTKRFRVRPENLACYCIGKTFASCMRHDFWGVIGVSSAL
jgi:hypothetical protein